MLFRRSITSLCLLAAFAAGTIGCNTAPADNSAEPEVRQWMADWTKAFGSRDLAGMNALYAADTRAYDLVPPLQYAGKDAYMKDWKDFFAEFQTLHTEMKDCHIQSSGNLATVECLNLLKGTSTKGEKMSSWLRVTTILRKDNGKWLDIHDHVSYPTDLATGKSVMDLKP
jgi:ketosteroid isomerase-like protein